MNKPLASGADEATVDVKHKFVRITGTRPGGMVCFEFAIGWPELFVDLMLPQAAFDDFCVRNQVQILNLSQLGSEHVTSRVV